MPRKGPVTKKPVVVDPVYGSPVVTQLVNKILLDGKKSIAESIVYGALEGAKDKSGAEPVTLLKKALDNVRPTVRFVLAVLVDRPTRFRLKLRHTAPTPSQCVGWFRTPRLAARRP